MYCCLFFFLFFFFFWRTGFSFCVWLLWVCGPWHECFLVVDWRESFVTLSTMFLKNKWSVLSVLQALLYWGFLTNCTWLIVMGRTISSAPAPPPHQVVFIQSFSWCALCQKHPPVPYGTIKRPAPPSLLPAKQRNCLLFLTLRPKPYPNRTGWPMSKAYCVMQREASDVQPTCLEWQVVKQVVTPSRSRAPGHCS